LIPFSFSFLTHEPFVTLITSKNSLFSESEEIEKYCFLFPSVTTKVLHASKFFNDFLISSEIFLLFATASKKSSLSLISLFCST